MPGIVATSVPVLVVMLSISVVSVESHTSIVSVSALSVLVLHPLARTVAVQVVQQHLVVPPIPPSLNALFDNYLAAVDRYDIPVKIGWILSDPHIVAGRYATCRRGIAFHGLRDCRVAARSIHDLKD